MQQTSMQFEAVQQLNTFSQALNFMLPIVVTLTVLAVLAAAVCLVGLFLTEKPRPQKPGQRHQPSTTPILRRTGQVVPISRFRRYSAKRAKLA